MEDFKSDNDTLMTFVTTIFVLGYASGPIVIAPMSEMYGRTIMYQVCAVFFLIFNIACAVANSLGSLVVYRFLAGVAASCPITLGPGSVADMVAEEKRAGAMGAYVVGVLFGSSLGPIIGGYLAPVMGWRWGFWVMTIITAPALLLVLFLPETYSYVLLQRKANKLRKATGNMHLSSVLDTGRTPKELFAFSIIRPLKMLLLPIVFLQSLYVAIVYSYLYIMFTTFPIVFGDQYNFGSGPSGLATLGIAVGSVIGSGACGVVMDRLSNYLAAKHGGGRKPEYRLPVMTIGGLLAPAGLFMYAWTAEKKTHWIAPIIGSGILACGLNIAFVSFLTTYLEIHN
jgi:multidrug resistance protein